ncbi:acyltransferase family protein [Kitasatospora sp. NBC_00070]|uniref:lysophospholipid acyltransferase family protein n=1 Tax=Kitasatospora sp. NBC_00070 TaxID=2975962 RepID=UPI00324373BD
MQSTAQHPAWQLVDSAVRLLSRYYFRVELVGLENLPDEGGALLAANHAGMIPLDSVLIVTAVRQHHPRGRTVHAIADELLFKVPVLGEQARRSGQVWATDPAGTRRLLTGGQLVLTYPEGVHGLGKGWANRYRVQDFGRGGFAAVAMAAGVPIVPVTVIGTEEAYPVLANCKPLARLLDLPYMPVTPTLPLLGLAGLLPLPAKVTLVFGEPIPTSPANGARALREQAGALAGEIRSVIQTTLDEWVGRRRHGGFG